MLSSTGLYPLRYETVEAQIDDAIQQAFGGNIDLSSDSLMGVYADVFGISETELWELSQAVYDSANLMSAEGAMLDNLALLVGIVRLPATGSRGVLWVGGSDGTVLPAESRFQSIIGDYFITELATNITTSACVRTTMEVNSLVQGESYTVTINGNVFRREATPNQTKTDILKYFEEVLPSDGTVTTGFGGTSFNPFLIIEHIDPTTTMEISATSYLSFPQVICPTIIVAEKTGAIEVEPHTVTYYIQEGNTHVTLDYVTNPVPLITGRALESDGDLRARLLAHYTTVAGGTPDAIAEAVRGISGVNSVKVIENTTSSTNARGMPPKSFQVIVDKGNDQLIAEAIWNTKPAGVHCYADRFSPLTISKTVLDYNSQSHLIRFIRPTTRYIWIYCQYTLYNEEVFPTSGELIMKEELAAFGQTLGIGNDVIPDRFYPSVYRNVKGVDDVELYFALTNDLNTTPVFPADYHQNIIPISDEEVTSFASFRVTPVKV